MSALLFEHFPTDQIVGEEDSSELNTPENVATKADIVRLANEAMGEVLTDGEAEWAGVKSVTRGETEWLSIIDRGNSTGGKTGRESLAALRRASLLKRAHDLLERVQATGRWTRLMEPRASSVVDSTPYASGSCSTARSSSE